MGDYLNGVAIDQPAGTARHNSHAADSWLEPWLIKHVSFYRKHMTKDGQAESASTRRHSVVSNALRSRENSVAEQHEDQVSGALPVETAPVQGRESVESEFRAENEAASLPSSPTESKKDKFVHSWKQSIVGWKPHP